MLLIDPELCTLARLAKLSFFFTGKTIPWAPSPKRENLGAVSAKAIQSSTGSREAETGRG